MVRFEYKVLDQHYKRTLPTSWSEMTVRDVLELQRMTDATPTDYISVMTSTPLEHIEAFPSDLKDILFDASQFIYDELLVLESKCPYEFKPLGELEVAQFEHWRTRPTMEHTLSLLHTSTELYAFSGRMNLVDSVMDMPADIGLYWQNYYNKEFADHVKKFAPLYEAYEPTDEEVNAGYEDLTKWGAYSTYEELAQGDIFRLEQVARLSVDNVYYYLLYKKTKNDYHKNLSDYAIQRAKNNH